ncbi:hypothetical protein PC128_g19825 [Phytophthora cactorum]|nr:hypothetical protein PC128_g19825 [Phytophthora cactorum]
MHHGANEDMVAEDGEDADAAVDHATIENAAVDMQETGDNAVGNMEVTSGTVVNDVVVGTEDGHAQHEHTRHQHANEKTLYRCSKFRQGCPGKMEFTVAYMGYSCVGAHTCRVALVAATVTDVQDEMRAQAALLAIENVAWTVRQVWEALRGRFYNAENPDGLSEQQVVQQVHRARRQHYSGNVHGSIEIPPLSLALYEAVSFFQFHYVTINRDDLSKPARLLGWSHPSLVALLRYHGTTLFVGGTFRCVPSEYAQCVVFMVHDRVSGVPVEIPSDIASDLEDEAAEAFPASDIALPLTTGGISLLAFPVCNPKRQLSETMQSLPSTALFVFMFVAITTLITRSDQKPDQFCIRSKKKIYLVI